MTGLFVLHWVAVAKLRTDVRLAGTAKRPRRGIAGFIHYGRPSRWT